MIELLIIGYLQEELQLQQIMLLMKYKLKKIIITNKWIYLQIIMKKSKSEKKK